MSSENDTFRILVTTNKTDRHFYGTFVHENFLCAHGEPIFSMLSYDKDDNSLPISGGIFTANAFLPFSPAESFEKFALLLEGPASSICQQPTSLKNKNKAGSSPKIAPNSDSNSLNKELKAMLLGMIYTVEKCHNNIVTGASKDSSMGEMWRLSDRSCSTFCGMMMYGAKSESKNAPRKPADWPKGKQFDCFTLFTELTEENGQRALFQDLVDQGKSQDQVMYIKVQATSKNHTRQGLGFKIAEECLRIAREKGMRHAVVEATGVGTQKIYEKLGFELKAKQDYQEKIGTFFEDNEYNRNVAQVHKSCNLYYLAL